MRRIATFVRELVRECIEDRVLVQAASLSYATVFALPPLLVIALAIVAMFFDQSLARAQILSQMRDMIGDQGAAAIQSLLENASRPSARRGLAAWLGAVALLVGSTGVFAQLQSALNTIWGVRPKTHGSALWRLVRKRVLTFGMVLSVGFLLLVSLAVSAALAALGDLLQARFSEIIAVTVIGAVDFVLSQAVLTLLLAAMFAILPDAKIPFRFVWVGAALTALLFTGGKWLIGLYLGKAAPGSAYGAAGSLAIVLIWIYYSSILVFCGAEFTQVYARLRGAKIHAEDLAVKVGGPRATAAPPPSGG